MKRTYLNLLVSAAVVALLFVPSHAWAQAPSLGTAASYGVLGAQAVTNTGSTVITGDLGISPKTASSVTGFPPGTYTGTLHAGDAPALQAQNDVTTAYNDLAGRACNTVLTGTDLGGLTLTPGVYCFASSAQLTGTLTLDAQLDPNAVFIFQMGSTLTTASNSRVLVINSGSNCNVFWQVGSSATLGTATTFAGNILALTSITLNTGASVSGRALARNGAVTMDTNNVAVCPTCVNPVILAPSTLPAGTVSTAYSQTITASEAGYAGSFTFDVISGTLPTGMTLSTAGVLSAAAGALTTAGSSTFTVRATDSNGCFGSEIYTMVINPAAACPDFTLSPPTIPAATAGIPYGPVTIQANLPGTAPFTYSMAGAPAWLVLTPTGVPSASAVLSGTPTTSGSFAVTITAVDALGCQGSHIYALVVNCPVITVGPASLPSATVGANYGPVAMTATGGTAPYSFVVTSGTLPPGLTLSTGGVLSGVLTSVGSFSFTVTVTDANGCQGARSYTVGGSLAAVGGPTLDSLGLTILVLLLAVAGAFIVNRVSL